MDQKSSSSKKHIYPVIITLICCVGFFHYWFSEQITNKALAVLTPATETVKQATNYQNIPQSLLDYIKKERASKNSATDTLNEDELMNAFKEFEKDYSNEANDILASRFKYPNLEGLDTAEGAFAIPEGIADIVEFWTHIFGLYTRDHVVFYNKQHVGIVYSVLDFSEVNYLKTGGIKSFKKKMIGEERARLKQMLKNISARFLDENPKFDGLTDEEKRIAKLIQNSDVKIDVTDKGLKNNFIYRYGFSHRIKKAIQVSGKYMPELQRIFKERGLPTELTIIPFIESSFNLNAYSSAGAAGIWQFIKATGKRYLRIDEFVDERYDPILAGYAAATHLSHEYKFLKTWPMTINAYNTGPGRMIKAKKQLNTTDISTIIKHYRGSGYGFDSRNYFPEFLAALHVYKNRDHYFGADLKDQVQEEYEYVAMPSDMNVKELSRLSGLNQKKLVAMNLTLKPAVVNGSKSLPKGYLLKIPPKSKQNILLAMQELYTDEGLATHHIAKKGEKLKDVAKRFDIKVKDLALMNQMLPNQKLATGQIIKLNEEEDSELNSNKDDKFELVIPDNLHTPIF
jgi:membrane-bound lytic murein transglycosylase D